MLKSVLSVKVKQQVFFEINQATHLFYVRIIIIEIFRIRITNVIIITLTTE